VNRVRVVTLGGTAATLGFTFTALAFPGDYVVPVPVSRLMGEEPDTHNTGDENETSSDDDCIGCHGTGWKNGRWENGDCQLCDGKGR
jgi:hypothetical protein